MKALVASVSVEVAPSEAEFTSRYKAAVVEVSKDEARQWSAERKATWMRTYGGAVADVSLPGQDPREVEAASVAALSKRFDQEGVDRYAESVGRQYADLERRLRATDVSHIQGVYSATAHQILLQPTSDLRTYVHEFLHAATRSVREEAGLSVATNEALTALATQYVLSKLSSSYNLEDQSLVGSYEEERSRLSVSLARGDANGAISQEEAVQAFLAGDVQMLRRIQLANQDKP